MPHMSPATFDTSSVYFGCIRGRPYDTVLRGYLGLFLGHTQHFCGYIGLFCFVFNTSRYFFGYGTVHVTNAWLWHLTYHFHMSLHLKVHFNIGFFRIYIRGCPIPQSQRTRLTQLTRGNVFRWYLGFFFEIYRALLCIHRALLWIHNAFSPFEQKPKITKTPK